MSTLDRLLQGIRDVLVLSTQVDRLGQDVGELARDVRNHEKRLIRLETMVEMAQGGAVRPRLGGPDQED